MTQNDLEINLPMHVPIQVNDEFGCLRNLVLVLQVCRKESSESNQYEPPVKFFSL